ncbi:uncharacterized protein [Diabrotica undecimpunctata]|uniref:uncharacterized protein n=1 Tax=Diabrotica undecimpunctata TaxID=50387 RepID=UPI003B636F68
MLPKNAVPFLLFATFISVSDASVRINFGRCGAGGFTCSTYPKTNTLAVYYNCVGDDVTLYINQFSSPANIETLLIQNCVNLTISFRCSGENKNIQVLTVRNVKRLKIEPQQYTSHVPTSVIFENIAYIEEIPKDTFAQIQRTTHSYGCINPRKDFYALSFKNVTIDTVGSRAFYMPQNFGNFTFTDVKINRLQTSALLAKLEKLSQFIIEDSKIDVVEHLAFQVTSKNVEIKNNKFVDIAGSAFNGTAEKFTFYNNYVNTFHPYAISILVTNVYIWKNTFEYLKSGALQKISPGLLEDSGRNFGSLRFIYQFKNNTIHSMDAGSLNPDVEAYKNVATKMMLEGNIIKCECINIGWIFSGSGHGSNTPMLENFYLTLLDPNSDNKCSASCNLPLSASSEMISNGKCSEDITVSLLCGSKDKLQITNNPTTTTTIVQSGTSPSKQTLKRPVVFFLNSKSTMFTKNFDLLLFVCFIYYFL